MNSLKLVEKLNNDTNITTRQLAKMSGQRHVDVVRRINKIHGMKKFSMCTYTQREFISRGKLEKEYELDILIVMEFVATSRKKNAPMMILQIADFIRGDQAEIKQLTQETKIKQLEAQNKMLEDNQTIVKIQGNQINTKHVHDIREELSKRGLCDRVTKESTRYKYPVTKLGLSKGYSNNKDGSIKVGHLI